MSLAQEIMILIQFYMCGLFLKVCTFIVGLESSCMSSVEILEAAGLAGHWLCYDGSRWG